MSGFHGFYGKGGVSVACRKHKQYNPDCLECLSSGLLNLTFEVESNHSNFKLEKQIKKLRETYYKLKLKGNDKEYIDTLIFGLNTKLIQYKKPLFCGTQLKILNEKKTDTNRANFKKNLKTMGTWIGYAELHVMASIFNVRMWIAFPYGKFFRKIPIGPQSGRMIHENVLCWTGNHYEVAVLKEKNREGLYTVQKTIQTNSLGDCAFESFLIVLISDSHDWMKHTYKFFSKFSGIIRTIIRQFKLAYNITKGKNIIPDDNTNYLDAIKLLRNVLAETMNIDQINNAIIAQGAVVTHFPASKKDQKGLKGVGRKKSWGDYINHVRKFFNLKQTLNIDKYAGAIYVVSNIGTFPLENAIKKSIRGRNVIDVLTLSHKSPHLYVLPKNDIPKIKKDIELKHIGFMVAKITMKETTCYLICVIANFDARFCETEIPYVLHGSQKDITRTPKKLPELFDSTKKSRKKKKILDALFGAQDMHTECYSFFILDRFIKEKSFKPNLIEIDFILQLDMCDRCQKAKELIQKKYSCLDLKGTFSTESSTTVKSVVIKEMGSIENLKKVEKNKGFKDKLFQPDK